MAVRKSKKIIKTQAVIKKLSLQRFSSLTLISTKDLHNIAIRTVLNFNIITDVANFSKTSNSLYSFAEPMFFQDGLVLFLICSSMSQNAKNDATHFMG